MPRSIRAWRSARRSPNRWSSTASAASRERQDRVAELLRRVGLTPDAATPLSARVFRRPAPAHLHRPGAGAGTEADRRRRKRRGTRRLRARPRARPDAGTAGDDGARLSVHLPRHGGHRADVAPCRGDARRQDRRDGHAPRGLREPEGRLYAGPDGRRADPRSENPSHGETGTPARPEPTCQQPSAE